MPLGICNETEHVCRVIAAGGWNGLLGVVGGLAVVLPACLFIHLLSPYAESLDFIELTIIFSHCMSVITILKC